MARSAPARHARGGGPGLVEARRLALGRVEQVADGPGFLRKPRYFFAPSRRHPRLLVVERRVVVAARASRGHRAALFQAFATMGVLAPGSSSPTRPDSSAPFSSRSTRASPCTCRRTRSWVRVPVYVFLTHVIQVSITLGAGVIGLGLQPVRSRRAEARQVRGSKSRRSKAAHRRRECPLSWPDSGPPDRRRACDSAKPLLDSAGIALTSRSCSPRALRRAQKPRARYSQGPRPAARLSATCALDLGYDVTEKDLEAAYFRSSAIRFLGPTPAASPARSKSWTGPIWYGSGVKLDEDAEYTTSGCSVTASAEAP